MFAVRFWGYVEPKYTLKKFYYKATNVQVSGTSYHQGKQRQQVAGLRIDATRSSDYIAPEDCLIFNWNGHGT